VANGSWWLGSWWLKTHFPTLAHNKVGFEFRYGSKRLSTSNGVESLFVFVINRDLFGNF
jgi:hypothetical protein